MRGNTRISLPISATSTPVRLDRAVAQNRHADARKGIEADIRRPRRVDALYECFSVPAAAPAVPARRLHSFCIRPTAADMTTL
jgi:hypothetical protein